MPTSARRLASAFPSSGNSVPSTEIVPDWMVSSRLIARQSVDLPEPEGPRTTTTSPERIVMLIFCKTCRSPKYLSTSDSTTTGAPTWPATGEAAALAESSMGLRLDDLGGECRDLVLRFGYVLGCRAAALSDYLLPIPQLRRKTSSGCSTSRSSCVGPGLKASGPQVIGSTATEVLRYGPPVKIWVQRMCSSPQT